ncbi:carboxypeptidase-like regulatory domain-containing protein [Chitinophaga sancti]|uniref:CarboxypepD_reg-like domain-containing protein n=1 Tax=Chitinophaga sancti TaxID=1004 RepID=A0A1K1LVA9_9BACT|nr:carboxypeptidase-like regulatory domain-containing protein [Chitinophaga sancti]WQD64893.1 carboxypeptidase-like regulatory domain-containing protein [Chitinophaga sancti]WQG89483.1 carboxypeptidase-like regulatory domain-containing protein [Chitinophaga sancti]SFW13606.1 CarboxypepD_reg-like domain-containing protein [Chitinophaga sancti]
MKRLVDPKFTLLSLLLLCTCTSLFAQMLKGTMYDAQTGEVIPYASAGVKNRSRGGIADRNGEYTIKLSGLAPTDSLVFSHIGYATLIFRVSDIDTAGRLDVKLVPRATSLSEVTVSVQREMLMLGSDKASSRYTGWGDYSSSRGRTRGLQLTPDKLPFKAVTFACRMKEMTFDSVKMRLNILGKVKGEPHLQQILQQNIYFNIYKDAKWVTVDLTPYKIVLTDTVVLAVEWVDAWMPAKTAGGNSCQLTIALGKDMGYFYERNTPNERPVLRQSMELPVMYLKGYKVGSADK